MAGSSEAKTRLRQSRDRQKDVLCDYEHENLQPELRWRGWMLRVEALIMPSTKPVTRETLARVVGRDGSVDLLVDDLMEGR
ncbi:hypothetical protein G6L94_31005 [Agrobacterium rhizogenes]|uniref:hypothetical protein n=1 Tax=Rhizobium rhizogenes TaxID=359 RepID=UPI00080FD0B4|nr:hypothetical protein [Rhizobium rhizogenes]OCJ16479.1 hypothetical protein A6U88_33845 [Agrobacterium sp. B131/95]OCJ27350.1 hypothetical protein A6U89_29730 [Agrobacterium sp. B133/95]NTI46649.1 hypothetical protein [Rhizobium rhizogenes]NTI52759.1 hypothetical protein [Rhizobium rhizogenes]NTI98132.1 hypothetical protein [Rhizobium rhizogenes]